MVSTTSIRWSKYEPTATLNSLASVAVKFLEYVHIQILKSYTHDSYIHTIDREKIVIKLISYGRMFYEIKTHKVF